MSVKKTMRDFTMWTSASAVPHIGRAPNMCMRIFWLVVFLACLITFLYEMCMLVQAYLEYDVIVNTKLEFRTLAFPAVTLCHLNPYKKSAVTSNPEIDKLLKAYQAAVRNTLEGEDDEWGFRTYNDTMGMQAHAREYIMYYVGGMKEEDKKSISYQLNDILRGCTFNSEKCSNDSFTPIMDPVFGQCFMFNNDKQYYTKRAGPKHGLRLMLVTDLAEYLDTTESAGFRISVNSPGEKVFPDAFGYNAAAGFTTSFGLQYVETESLGPPYDICVHKRATEYSLEGCFRMCLQKRIVRMCGCCSPAFKCYRNVTYCNKDKFSCVANVTDNGGSNEVGGGNRKQDCDCQYLCKTSSYSLTSSSSNWPSSSFKPRFCQVQFEQGKTGGMNAHSWCAQNAMMIEIFFERMNYLAMTESPAYGLVSLMSDFGGQIGLWIGVSFITFVEFVFFPILLLVTCCCKKKKYYDVHEYDEVDNEFDKVGGTDYQPPPPYQQEKNPDHGPFTGRLPPPRSQEDHVVHPPPSAPYSTHQDPYMGMNMDTERPSISR